MDNYFCIIIGAGPAGLAAAIAAARGRGSVLVIEKKPQPGQKLLITGGGRANVMDSSTQALDALDAFGRSGKFLRQSLASFNWHDFLEDLDIRVEREKSGLREGSVYVRGGAGQLLEALTRAAKLAGVLFATGETIRGALTASGGFEITTDSRKLKCSRLVLATGGMTYPATGSSGDGYAIAASLGHDIEPPRPALCALETDPHFPKLAGVAVADALLMLRASGKRIAERRGGLLFTHQGISGPPLLDLSLELARACESPKEVVGAEIIADMLPDVSLERLVESMLTSSQEHPKRFLANAYPLRALSSRFTEDLVRRAGLESTRQMGGISRKDFTSLAKEVKSLTITIRRPLDPNASMVTVGGVRTKEVDPHTMESRLLPGLYFAGELLAPAGPCGGYNLLMAFATGWAAGMAIASAE